MAATMMVHDIVSSALWDHLSILGEAMWFRKVVIVVNENKAQALAFVRARPAEAVLLHLHAAGSQGCHGYAIIKNEPRLGSGTLYPLLARMEAEGIVTSKWEDWQEHERACEESHSRPRRRIYNLTDEGTKRALAILSQYEWTANHQGSASRDPGSTGTECRREVMEMSSSRQRQLELEELPVLRERVLGSHEARLKHDERSDDADITGKLVAGP
jgi:PadR family transcriptional regulator PadR